MICVGHRSQTIGPAQGGGVARTSLLLVQNGVVKGAAGARAVTTNADALTRHALSDVLKLAAQPHQRRTLRAWSGERRSTRL
jgi:hypothetical protein